MSANVVFGEKEEQRLKPVLSSYFDRKLYSTDKYSIFDFHCGKKFIYIELKSLRHTSNKYSTTMIGYNKIEEAVRKKNLVAEYSLFSILSIVFDISKSVTIFYLIQIGLNLLTENSISISLLSFWIL